MTNLVLLSAKKKTKSLSKKVLQNILKHSEDTMPLILPPVSADEDMEMAERRKAEDYFQHALCRRIWWKLSSQERRAIKAQVLEENIWTPSDLEYSCIRKIEDEVKAARSPIP